MYGEWCTLLVLQIYDMATDALLPLSITLLSVSYAYEI